MKILFVCTNNISRSQAAKGLYNLLTNTKNADSAGILTRIPGETVQAVDEYYRISDIEIMVGKGVNISDFPRRQLTPEMLAQYDLVVNIAERDQTPDWLRGENIIWWDIPDVPEGDPDIVARKKLFNEVENRVRKLIKLEKSGSDFRELDDDIDAKIPFAELIKQRDNLAKQIEIGATYRHYKGDLYRVVDLAFREDAAAWSVNYENVDHPGVIFNRLAKIWLESVKNESGATVPRFAKINKGAENA